MARPQNSVWRLYDTIVAKGPGKAYPDVRCKNCDVDIKNGRPDRNLLTHALQCPKITEEEKAEWKRISADYAATKIQKIGKGTYTPRKSPRKSSRSDTSSRYKISSPTRYLPFTSPSSAEKRRKERQAKAEHQMAVAKAFYSTGISFRCVEDPFFQALFDYPLPTRKELAGGLLDDTFVEERSRIIDFLKGKKQLALVSDGWSSVNNDSIINFVLVRPDMRPVFWSSLATGDESHNGKYIARILSTKIREIEEVAGEGAITSVVTDNASAMKTAWAFLRRERPSLFCHGCSAHNVDLLVKDIFKIKELQIVLKKCKTVTNFVKVHHGLWYRFRELLLQQRRDGNPHARRPSLPVSTRWYSSEACIRHIIENRQVFMMILSDSELLDGCRQKKKKKSGESERTSEQLTQRESADVVSVRSTPPTKALHQSSSLLQLSQQASSSSWASLPRAQSVYAPSPTSQETHSSLLPWTSLPLTQLSQSPSSQQTRWPSPSQSSLPSSQSVYAPSPSSQETQWPSPSQSSLPSSQSVYAPSPTSQTTSGTQSSSQSWTSLPLTQPSQSVYAPTPSQSMRWSSPLLRVTQPTPLTGPCYQPELVQAQPATHHLPSLVLQHHELSQQFTMGSQNVRSMGRSELDHERQQGRDQRLPQPHGEQISDQQAPPDPVQPDSEQRPEPDNVDTVKEILSDDQFWKSGQEALELIHPVNQCIAMFERDNCCISMVCHLMHKLLTNATYTKITPRIASSLQSKILKTIKSRKEKICSEFPEAAYFLDWNKPLDYFENTTKAIEKIAALANKRNLLGGASLQTFTDTLGKFVDAKILAASTRSPSAPIHDPARWWRLDKDYGCLQEFALRVFSVPTSSAASERSWSIHKFIQSKNRNRLKHERVSKLAFIYSNLTNTGKVNTLIYELFPEASDDDTRELFPEGGDDTTRELFPEASDSGNPA